MYYDVKLESALGQQLAGTVVVEYPTLLLVWQELERYALAPAPP